MYGSQSLLNQNDMQIEFHGQVHACLLKNGSWNLFTKMESQPQQSQCLHIIYIEWHTAKYVANKAVKMLLSTINVIEFKD